MTDLKELLDELRAAAGIRLVRHDLSCLREHGVLCDALCMVALRLTVIDSAVTDQRQANVLDLHEYGHHEYLTEDLVAAPPLLSQMEEARAERVAASISLAPDRIAEAAEAGCETEHDFAQALGITVDAFSDWFGIMQRKYGEKPVYTTRYRVTFSPLTVTNLASDERDTYAESEQKGLKKRRPPGAPTDK